MKTRQSGQVLPLGLVLVVFCVVGALMLFNTGQVASDKMRLANAADAAAYSGALWQARALNYQAYSNRAMVANQVAIGQAVSLNSWMNYAAVTSEHIATALKPVPVLNIVTSGIQAGVAAADTVVSLSTQAMLTLSTVATKALSSSQNAMIAAAGYSSSDVMSVVASTTDPRFTTNSRYGIQATGQNVLEWLSFNEQYTKKDKPAMKERQSLIMASRDRFTRQRNWDLFGTWMPIDTSLIRYADLVREGNTRLTAVDTPNGLEWEWMSKDTLSIQTKKLRFGRSSKKAEVPIAWASSFANSRSSRRAIKKQQCGMLAVLGISFGKQKKCVKFVRKNRTAEELADTNFRSFGTGRRTLRPLTGYKGVQSFWVLSDKARKAERARLNIKVEVSLPVSTLRESDKILQADILSNPVVVAGNALSSISIATVSYQRPNDNFLNKSRLEKANAYNPYWQVQLAPVSTTERLLALGMRPGVL